jgi:hypothetical protein
MQGVRQMWMEMEYQGKTYKTKATDKISQGKVAEELHNNFSNMDRLQMELEDGSIIVIGKIALQSAVIRIYA